MTGWRRNLVWTGLGLVFLASLYLVAILGLWFAYSDKIMPGVSIAGVSYSGKTEEVVIADLQQRAEEYLREGNPYEIQYDLAETTAEAMKSVSNPFQLGRRKEVALSFEYNSEALYKELGAYQKKNRREVRNPYITRKDGELKIIDGLIGFRVPYGENVRRFESMTGTFESGFVPSGVNIEPAYSVSELEQSIDLARGLADRGLTLEFDSQKFSVPEEELVTWVGATSQKTPLGRRLGEYSSLFNSSKVSAGFNEPRIEGFLAGVAKKIDREPINATLRMQNGKATVFSLSQTGLSLNIEESLRRVVEAINTNEIQIGLVVDETEPEITQNSLASLGIVELIAEGRSNFAGSTASRRHNIRVGAAKFDGIIIKPDEIFSFTKNLGPVDASTGYLPELVIKKNETVPEFGGGLCQVSSTAFRAALNAGLPITARKAHAYPVTYYKPYGTDATIYIPNPDIKFKNDTGHHILIQTRMVGNNLYFDFYGTKKPGSVKFAGNKQGAGAVDRIEDVTPYIYDKGVRGEGSFTAVFWQFFYDSAGKLTGTDDFVSKYDSPLKYPH